jgi:hypothetical protein
MHIRFVKISKNHYHLQIKNFYRWKYKKTTGNGEFSAEIMDFNSEKEGLKYLKNKHKKDTTFFIYPTIKLK